MRDICVVGVGKMGGALAIALVRAGWRVAQLIVRDDRVAKKIKRELEPATRISQIDGVKTISPGIIFITVDDPEIPNVVKSLSAFVTKNHVVFHTSGSVSSSALADLARRGAAVGSIHPLTSISDPLAGSEQFRGTYFCVEGDLKAVTLGRRIVRSLGGKAFTIDSRAKALYHAAAVTAAGHVTALFEGAVQMMAKSGPDERTAKKILLPLVQSAVSNLQRQNAADALTGTFSRLDMKTFQRHISSFDVLPENLVHVYLELGEQSLDLVEQRDGPSARIGAFRKAISVAKRKHRC